MTRRHEVRPARLAALLALALLAGCTRKPLSVPAPRYVVGAGYQLGGAWFYPREDFHYDATGIATVLPPATGLTANGEAIDPGAVTAAHQTLQLPAVARVTNLENGLSLLVRINDRGPPAPSRLVGLSRRAAELLGVSGPARVRVVVEEGPSTALREQLQGGPRLQLAAAPRSAVASEQLAPPPGVAQSARGRSAGSTMPATQTAAAPDRVPDRLPETVTRGPAQPGTLSIRAGSFGQASYANQVVARLQGLGARVEPQREGRTARYEVRIGPYPDIQAADAALDQARRAGVTDARIVVE